MTLGGNIIKINRGGNFLETINGKKRIFYGWYIVAVCFLIMALIYAPMVSAKGLFVTPILKELKFSTSSYMMTSTITSLVGVAVAVVLGKLYSKKHARMVLFICVAGISICFGMYSFAYTLTQFYIIAFFAGLFFGGATLMPVSILITFWFHKQRGLALSIAFVGSSVGAVLLSPLIGKLLVSVGWRHTYQYLAILMFCVLAPLVLLVVRQKPADKGLKPYGYGETVSSTKKSESEWNASLKDIKNLPLFWVFLFAATSIMLTGGVIVHIPAYIIKSGYKTADAALFVSIYSFVAIFGKVALGRIFDRLGPTSGIIFGNGLFILSIVSLFFIKIPIMLYVMAVLYGFGTCIGTVTIPVLTARIFGPKNYGDIYGVVNTFAQFGGAFGALTIAFFLDKTGTYNASWIFVISLAAVMTISLIYSATAGLRKGANKEKAENLNTIA